MNQNINLTNVLLGLLIIVILVGGGLYFLNIDNKGKVTKPTINVRGEAIKSIPPDLVNIGFSIETEGNTTLDSTTKNAAELSRIKSKLLEMGINQSEIESSSYYTNPIYNESCNNYCHIIPIEAISARPLPADYSSTYVDGNCERNCNVIGYKTTHSITVKSKEVNKGADLAQKILEGSNRSKIDYAFFTIKEETQIKVQNELEALAAKNTREKAQNIASGLNATLGRLISITPEGGYGYPMPMYAYDKAVAGTSELVSPSPAEIFPTQSTLRSAVIATYEIE